ncbi:MAG: ABC transporter permease [Vicinamibacterales bacterium]
MESLRQDIRIGIRLLLKQPGFSLLAVTTLALGIGLSTALFSVLDAAFIRPLPYPNPEQLVEIHVEQKSRGGRVGRGAPSIEDVEDWQAHGQVFSHLAIWDYDFTEPLILDGAQPMRLLAQLASKDYFAMYGVTPFLGRTFTDDELAVGGPNVVILGHDFWRTRFSADPNIVGTLVRLSDEPATVVGVMPAAFYAENKIWRPFRVDPKWRASRGSGTQIEGRLREGVTLAEAETALTAVTARAAEARGGRPAPVRLTSLYESATRSNVRTARIIGYAVALILLLACVNVAGLLLARGAVRRPELAVRASLGAGRWRLVRQLLTESVVLALAGGAVGGALAWLSLETLVANLPMFLPDNAPVTINIKALSFAMAASLATGILFGLVPALRVSRIGLLDALSRAGRGRGSALSRRGGQTLIAVEIALAVVLLMGAALMVRSFGRIMAVDVGFEPDAFVGMEVAPAAAGSQAVQQFYPVLLDRLRTHPGVASVGAVDHPPLAGGSTQTSARVGPESTGVHIREFLGEYFDAVGFTLKQGRFPVDADRLRSTPLVVINEAAARALFPAGSPLGRQFGLASRPTAYEVAAVIADARHGGPLREVDPEVFLPFGRGLREPGELTVVVRPHARGSITGDDLRRVAQSAGQRAVVDRIRPGTDLLGARVITPRRRTVLLGLLGGLGFLLALVGVFGMTAYAVSRRTQEIGVRMTFGATPRSVVGVMLRDSAWPVAAGIVFGLIGSWWATRVIESFLFETPPRDVMTFAAVAVVLAAAACVAAWIPARRAARVDPIVALRAE